MALTITGLSKNLYLSNNPIYVEIQETLQADFFSIKIGDFSQIRLSHINGYAKVDISSYIKASYTDVNFINLQITIISWEYNSAMVPLAMNIYNVSKTFIRGGIRGDFSNTTLQPNAFLKVTEKIPYWSGYFATYDTVDSSGITTNILNPDGLNWVERRKIKGCNPTYVRFLNSVGGNSYWMFEGISDNQKNSHSGIINNSITNDLGNALDQELELFSKVPKAYMPLMQDLIISPEIYIYRLGEAGIEWDRYYSGSNSIDYNPAKNAQSVKIKLKPFQKFNSERIWG